MKKTKINRKTKLSILIPVLNEGINLKILLNILRATIKVPHEVLIVYDRPDDDDIPVVKAMQKNYAGLQSVHNTLGRGIPNAIRTGVNNAKFDYILILVADDIGPVLAVDEMVALMDGGCDLVSATRYSYGGRILGGFFISRLLSRILNKVFRVISRSVLTDPTIGIKMFRKDIFNKLNLEARPLGWAIAFEMSIKSQIFGLKLGEVPIISINRFYGGKSSFKLKSWAPEYFKWFFWGLTHLLFSSRKKNKIKIRIPEWIKSGE